MVGGGASSVPARPVPSVAVTSRDPAEAAAAKVRNHRGARSRELCRAGAGRARVSHGPAPRTRWRQPLPRRVTSARLAEVQAARGDLLQFRCLKGTGPRILKHLRDDSPHSPVESEAHFISHCTVKY